MIFFRVLLFCTLATFAMAAPTFMEIPHTGMDPKEPCRTMDFELQDLSHLRTDFDEKRVRTRITGYWHSDTVSEHWVSSQLVWTSHALIARGIYQSQEWHRNMGSRSGARAYQS